MRSISILMFLALPALADSFDADIVLLGEIHDNPAHHARQAELVAHINPPALVFEMLSSEQASRHIPGGDETALATAFAWSQSGWPDFALYYPIFAAAPQAQVYGAAVPRLQAREAMKVGLPAAFGADAESYGLLDPLEEAEQSEREAMQMAAHCDALPESMLPAMVDIQRLRDAMLARTAIAAFEATGGPVVIITGNGHARSDWGVPVYIKRAAPQISVSSLGQGEDGQAPAGAFESSENLAPKVDRPDPCAAFK